ncbi:MAG: O-antigen ligase domain-containing protein, partial [Pseudanabaenales cyanobacterium]|nr:O-antigen ligase domain-containing protein [Pseudanabaenales cyanobacterium]
MGLVLFLALGFLIGAGRFLVLLFPLGSIVVGVFLYRRYPIFYVGFTWWLWFLGPLVRRLIDYQSGHLTYGP